MTRPVVDASPFIVFAKAGRFGLLHELLGEVLVPEQVFQEVVAAGVGRPGAAELAAARWVEVVPVAEPVDLGLPPTLGAGDRAAVALAHERALPLYSDDRAVRRAARRLSVPVVGTLGLLRAAGRAGRIPAARPLADELVRAGLRIRTDLYDRWVRSLDE